MDGSVNPSEVATLGLAGLAGVTGGYGPYGRGYGGYANMSTVQHALDANRQFSENSMDCMADRFGQGLSSIVGAFENATRDRQFANLRDGQVDAERRISDQIRDQDKTIEANARAAAECCCALKLQAAEDKAQILAAIAAQGAKTTERELDRAEREIIYLRSRHPHHP